LFGALQEGDESFTQNWVLGEMQMFADEACTETFTVRETFTFPGSSHQRCTPRAMLRAASHESGSLRGCADQQELPLML
jgi:hypothetical protein